MATEYSFDVVSKVDITEVKNAIDQTEREITTRFDFRNTKSKIELEENQIKLLSDDEFHLTTLIDILRGKMAKRNISLKALEYGKIEGGSHGTARQTITLRQGIPIDEARALVKRIKDAGIKANAQIQGEQLRVSGKDKDGLQAVQKLIRSIPDLPYDVEFSNYR
jgi:cyclic-di-GMP-binding protein